MSRSCGSNAARACGDHGASPPGGPTEKWCAAQSSLRPIPTAPAPKITSFTPAFELVGTSVTITETNFSGTVSREPHDERGEVQHHQRYDVHGELGRRRFMATVPTGATMDKIC